ncbi:extracellular solute-binding protein [Haloarcula sp. S1CR25-12]|uniref:Extracellular solute-binding protein n=1 Tax=Haloarcula saliterrae TaxID=2950534 RepID=A0ABU2FDJ0_9EURY|nr:extracellular solute-binding protein [Haloarcula sp. S1CR25-12]MDS0259876.1 extracellular solute-binding protein [Haloarcula sp. S1CR25-12]
MTDRITDGISRRSALKSLAVTGTVGLAGCGGIFSESETEYGPTDIPPKQRGIKEWGQKLNEHAREAGIDWDQFSGDDITLTFGMGLHPYSTTFSTQAEDGTMVKDYFEDLTGITVDYEIVSEDQFWLETENALSSDDNPYDGIMNGLWPSGGYHFGDDGNAWVRDLIPYINNSSLTDKQWLRMGDFKRQTIELMSYPNADGTVELTALPNGIEAYGCTAIHKPTFETLGLSEPRNFAELESAAKTISESNEVSREGIVSRTSSTTLSSANWGTMFKTYGGEWIDRDARTATLNQEQGVKSLERFGGMLNKYGPSNPGTYDWYANNNAYSNGEVGMMYSTPQTSGIVDTQIMEETKWLPPLQGPDGRDPIVDTWVWATGITATSDNPEAAWLYIQWANSRMANLMLSTRQWRGDGPRAGYARFDYVKNQVDQGNTPPVPGEGYINAFEQGMNNVPGGNPDSPGEYPPVPVDTPQNMNIMSEAAQAMSSVVSGQRTAKKALDDAATKIEDDGYLTESAIPSRYIANDRFLTRDYGQEFGGS